MGDPEAEALDKHQTRLHTNTMASPPASSSSSSLTLLEVSAFLLSSLVAVAAFRDAEETSFKEKARRMVSKSLDALKEKLGMGKKAKRRVMMMRNQHFSSRLSVSYSNSDPLMIMEGHGSRLFDESGIGYLDTRNNVAHCGHCHPHVVEAVQKQVALLNTNTRYLHPNVTQLGQRLLAKFPDSLSKIFFCNSGSEANDLALRLARAYAGGSDNTIVVEGAYHGHTLAVLDVSPYKFLKGTEYDLHSQPDGHKAPGPHIWQVPVPDMYRGKHKSSNAAEEYAKYVEQACEHFQTKGEKVRAFIMEGGLSIGGVIMPPQGYMERVAKAVRAAGGVYIADEVQTGFGRYGECFWAFQHGGETTVPDIVTMGKPIGNGMPLAAVVCTQEVAKAFEDKGVDYFNTFGGNPVSSAAGLAVLDVIESENLQQHALELGNYMRQQFQKSMDTVELIGDVRGSGLFMGLELVRDRQTLEPATAETHFICSVLRQKYHILTSIDGLHDNVFVVKPPMAFSKKDVDYFVKCFCRAALQDLPRAGDLSNAKLTPT